MDAFAKIERFVYKQLYEGVESHPNLSLKNMSWYVRNKDARNTNKTGSRAGSRAGSKAVSRADSTEPLFLPEEASLNEIRDEAERNQKNQLMSSGRQKMEEQLDFDTKQQKDAQKNKKKRILIAVQEAFRTCEHTCCSVFSHCPAAV